MNVGERFCAEDGSPISAVRKTRTSSPAEIAPRTTRRTVRAQQPLEPAGSGVPGAPPLELRALPERTEREEREDEDDRAAPEEEPIGTGRSLTPADPVREQRQGRTSSSAIWRPRSSSSISKPARRGRLEADRCRARREQRRPSGRSRAGARGRRARRSTTSTTCRPCLTENRFTVGAVSPGTMIRDRDDLGGSGGRRRRLGRRRSVVICLGRRGSVSGGRRSRRPGRLVVVVGSEREEEADEQAEPRGDQCDLAEVGAHSRGRLTTLGHVEAGWPREQAVPGLAGADKPGPARGQRSTPCAQRAESLQPATVEHRTALGLTGRPTAHVARAAGSLGVDVRRTRCGYSAGRSPVPTALGADERDAPRATPAPSGADDACPTRLRQASSLADRR